MNLRPFAAAVSFLLAAGTPNPALVIAQDAPCDARPRWLVVTVVGVTFSDALDDTEDLELGYQGSEVMDRCRIIEIREPLGEEKRSGGDVRTVITQDHTTYVLEINYVQESVQEICAVLDDCADATAPAARK